jgi:hypothetical protein
MLAREIMKSCDRKSAPGTERGAALARWCARFVGMLPLAAVCLLPVSCGKPAAPPPSTAPAPAPATNAPAAAVRPEFTKLAGRWERPDGGYVLEIRSIDTSGKMDAGYFNPGPINVSKALALQEGAATKVFVELRDANYPGCTYSLTYDPKSDQLFGQYFQAAMQQTFDVTFGRLK